MAHTLSIHGKTSQIGEEMFFAATATVAAAGDVTNQDCSSGQCGVSVQEDAGQIAKGAHNHHWDEVAVGTRPRAHFALGESVPPGFVEVDGTSGTNFDLLGMSATTPNGATAAQEGPFTARTLFSKYAEMSSRSRIVGVPSEGWLRPTDWQVESPWQDVRTLLCLHGTVAGSHDAGEASQ